MSDWGAEDQRILRSLRAVDEPTEQDRGRVAARLEAELSISLGLGATLVGLATTSTSVAGATAANVATTAASVASAPSTGGTLGLLGLAKWSVAVVAVGAAGWVASTWSERSVDTPDPSSVAPSAPRTTSAPPLRPTPRDARTKDAPPELEQPALTPPTLTSPAPTPESETTASRRTATRAPTSAPSKTFGLEDELALIGDAQKALAKNDATRALTLLERHAHDYPRGTLQLERSGLLAIASCQSGRTTEGRARATRFLSAHANSPLAARIRKSCGLAE